MKLFLLKVQNLCYKREIFHFGAAFLLFPCNKNDSYQLDEKYFLTRSSFKFIWINITLALLFLLT
ncbi:hypothetical protein BJK08_05190 [Legionella pneumophila]|nr:hypothetical protein BJK08_05190 [Legionella pneumophila]